MMSVIIWAYLVVRAAVTEALQGADSAAMVE